MLVLCCGSRNWTNWSKVEQALYRMLPTVGFFRVLHGGARGADSISGEAAQLLGLDVEIVYPDWKQHGRRAGMLRNTAMLERHPDYVIAFWDGVSRGTLDTIAKAVNVYRIPVVIVRGGDG